MFYTTKPSAYKQLRDSKTLGRSIPKFNNTPKNQNSGSSLVFKNNNSLCQWHWHDWGWWRAGIFASHVSRSSRSLTSIKGLRLRKWSRPCFALALRQISKERVKKLKQKKISDYFTSSIQLFTCYSQNSIQWHSKGPEKDATISSCHYIERLFSLLALLIYQLNKIKVPLYRVCHCIELPLYRVLTVVEVVCDFIFF